MAEISGTIVEYSAVDALGWIATAGGERIRFGLTALEHFDGPPALGQPVRVLDVTTGFRGVQKATRVWPGDHREPPPLDPAAILRALRLDPALARPSWPETHAALVDAYRLTGDRARHDRDRCFAVAAGPTRTSDDRLRALLAGWTGEPGDPEDPITHAADVFLIRDAHGDGERGTGPQLFALEGPTGIVYVLRTWAEREAVPGGDRLEVSICWFPDTDSALDGLFRARGVRRSMAAHAPGCAICQANLRDSLGPDGADDWQALRG